MNIHIPIDPQTICIAVAALSVLISYIVGIVVCRKGFAEEPARDRTAGIATFYMLTWFVSPLWTPFYIIIHLLFGNLIVKGK